MFYFAELNKTMQLSFSKTLHSRVDFYFKEIAYLKLLVITTVKLNNNSYSKLA